MSIALTEIIDIFWLIEKAEEYWDDKTEGGMSQVILMFVVALFFFKIILFFVMWKASLNFKKFVRQQRELVGAR